MTPHDPLVGTRTLLAAIQEFHRLRARHEHRKRLSPDEERVFAILEEIFEPVRIVSRGTRRRPLSLGVNRRALLRTTGGPARGRVIRIALRRAWVKTEAALAPREEVCIPIANAAGDRFYTFRGRVSRTYPVSKVATVELLGAEQTSSSEGESSAAPEGAIAGSAAGDPTAR